MLSLLILTACDALPRDPEGTLNDITAQKQFKVGVVSGTQRDGAVTRLLAAVEKRTHARAVINEGAADPLLEALKDGKLDLIVGPFAKDSPWVEDVAFAPALTRHGNIEIKAATRNGENRWIMIVERASRTATEVPER